MKKTYCDLTCETDYFSARQEGAVVFFRIKGNRLLASTLFSAKRAVLDYFAFAEEHPEARIMMLMPVRKMERDDYLTFFDMVNSGRISEDAVMRLYRTIDQFILKILASDLFFISVDHGQILPLFASVSLACDFIVMGEDAVFQNPALELMLSDRSITAEEAKALGFVNRCVPVEELEEAALAAARRFEALPAWPNGWSTTPPKRFSSTWSMRTMS